MRFLPECAPKELSISENGMVLVQKHSQYSTAVASIGLVAGMFYWEVVGIFVKKKLISSSDLDIVLMEIPQ